MEEVKRCKICTETAPFASFKMSVQDQRRIFFAKQCSGDREMRLLDGRWLSVCRRASLLFPVDGAKEGHLVHKGSWWSRIRVRSFQDKRWVHRLTANTLIHPFTIHFSYGRNLPGNRKTPRSHRTANIFFKTLLQNTQKMQVIVSLVS